MDSQGFNPDPFSEPEGTRFSTLIKKPWFLILVCVIVVFGVGLLSVNRIMTAVLHSRPEIVVPDLEGKSLVEAMKITADLDLSLHQDGTEFDEGLPAGTVLRQHPPTGMHIRAGRAIQVVISKGGQAVFVPGVVGRSMAEAQSMIQAEKLQLGAVSSVYSTDISEGLVVSQDPSSGTVATRGVLIDLNVSKGMPPAGAPLVPNFIGQSADSVRDWAEGVHASVKVVEDPKATGPAGSVVRQSPDEGQPLMEGDGIRITVVAFTAQSGERFRFEVPSEKGKVSVRIVARDNRGESQIYKKTHSGGDIVELPISVTSTTRIRVYVDEALSEEKVLEP